MSADNGRQDGNEGIIESLGRQKAVINMVLEAWRGQRADPTAESAQPDHLITLLADTAHCLQANIMRAEALLDEREDLRRRLDRRERMWDEDLARRTERDHLRIKFLEARMDAMVNLVSKIDLCRPVVIMVEKDLFTRRTDEPVAESPLLPVRPISPAFPCAVCGTPLPDGHGNVCDECRKSEGTE